jgi:hypothetical protein
MGVILLAGPLMKSAGTSMDSISPSAIVIIDK